MASTLVDRIINNKQTDEDTKFLQYMMRKRKKPKKSELLKFPNYRPDFLHVADLIELPQDRQYK